jgi:hypothetical protein
MPAAVVLQQETVPGLPHVDRLAQRCTVLLQLRVSSMAAMRAASTSREQRT